MVRRTWLLYQYLWPGIVPLLVRPTLTAWLGSALLAVTFHLLLAATILWPEWLSPAERGLLWSALGVAWLTGVAWSYQFVRGAPRREQRRSSKDAFPTAMHAYLQGNLAQAESLVREILRECPRDVEAALLLATIWRRREQLDAAEKLLRNLARLEIAAPWLFEIERELARLAKCRQESENSHLTDEEKEAVPAEPPAHSLPPCSTEAVTLSNHSAVPEESVPSSKAA